MSDEKKNGEPKTIAAPKSSAERGEIVRTGFGTGELEKSAETAATVLSAQAEAMVKARFVMALQRPRDIESVRVKILAACARPFFAELAVYAKPVGKKLNKETGEWEEQYAEGLSIRFAEEAIRNFGNAMTDKSVVYDDPKKRILSVSATDFEANVVHFASVHSDKTVERRVLKPGQTALGKRTNSYGDLVFIVEATEDEFATKIGALSSKALRDKILMLIPSDIQEEGKAICFRTNADKDAKDPEAARRKLVDSFAKIGVTPPQLTELIGHDLSTLQPAELQRLRAIYSAINEGESTWGDVIGQKRDFEKERADRAKEKATAPGAKPANLNELANASQAKREGASGSSQAAQPGATATTAAAKPSVIPTTPSATKPAEERERGDDPMLDNPDWMKG